MSITPMRPWLAAILAAFALFTTTAPLVAATPLPHVDVGSDLFYLDLLKGSYAYNQYGEQALLQEGHKLCSAMRHGASEDTATDMVRSDLGASTYEAFRVVSAAQLGLDCSSLKTHGM